MLDVEAIEREIRCLEEEETDFDTCEKLAILYTVRDHARQRPSSAVERTEGSEFMEAASGVDLGALMEVLDAHMESLKVVAPKAHSSVITKIRALK